MKKLNRISAAYLAQPPTGVALNRVAYVVAGVAVRAEKLAICAVSAALHGTRAVRCYANYLFAADATLAYCKTVVFTFRTPKITVDFWLFCSLVTF